MPDAYWVPPEDLTAAWANMRNDLEQDAHGNGGKMLRVTIFVSRGNYDGRFQSEAVQIEPRASMANAPAQTWWSVIRRLRSVASIGFVGNISIDVLLDGRECPVQWTEPKCTAYAGVNRR